MDMHRLCFLMVIGVCFAVVVSGCGESRFKHALEHAHFGKTKTMLAFRPGLTDFKDEDGRTPLHLAALRGQDDFAKLFIKKGAVLDVQDRYGFAPLHYACQKGHAGIVRILIAHGAQIETRTHYDHTLLHWAAWRGHRGVVEILLESGADPRARDKNGESPAQLAEEYGYRRVAELLYPLHKAARAGDREGIHSWLDRHPESIDEQDGEGKTPLHIAMRYDQPEVAGLLVQLGADTGVKDNYGYPPSHYSVEERLQRTGTDLLDVDFEVDIDHACYGMLEKYNHVKVAVVIDGEIVYTKVYGASKFDEDNVWGSVSKPLTAMLIMHLKSIGLITSLDDPIWKYAPGYLGCMPEEYADAALTIRHLLIHKSGVPHNDEATWKGNRLNLKFRPGERFQYSTPGYGILGHVIQGATGMSYGEAVKKYIAAPVVAPSYWAEDHFRAPGARVHSTVADMARFAVGVFDHVYVDEEALNGMIDKGGIGWGVTNPEGLDVTLQHGGSNGRPDAFLLIKPRRRMAVCLLGLSKDRHVFEMDVLALRLMRLLDDMHDVDD